MRQARILALAVEKTGYPADMLDLDLDLEADLGVDTVKQAEIFAAIREMYNIPRDENRKLRDYPTLAHVIRFVMEKRPDLGSCRDSNAAAAGPKQLVAEPVTAVTAGSVIAAPGRGCDRERNPNPSPNTAATGRIGCSTHPRAGCREDGLPEEMLDLELDLEADLGVDTVKQAELFAAIRFHLQHSAR